MTATIAAIAAAALGVLIGLVIRGIDKRRASGDQHASRRSQVFIVAWMLLAGVFLLVLAITEPGHRYVNLAIAAVLVVLALTQLRNMRHEPGKSHRPQ